MLDLFKHPNSAPHTQANLDTLNHFIDWVKASSLPENTQDDAIKILETMRWIKVNQEELGIFIDNKAAYLNQLPLRDQSNGVIRDHKDTSIHFNSYQWFYTIHLSSDPTAMQLQTLQSLTPHLPAYALFQNTLYRINHDASLEAFPVQADDLPDLIAAFPSAQGIPKEGTRHSRAMIQKITTQPLNTPGESALRDLNTIVDTFETTFNKLLTTNNTLGLLSFIAQCNYDKNVGCLEARVEKATLFAGKVAATDSQYSDLLDLLHICQGLHFLNLENDTVNFIMASEFFTPFYGQPVVYLENTTELNEALVFHAMQDLLGYNRPDEAELNAEILLKTNNPEQWQSKIFQALIKNATVTHNQGKIEYRFPGGEQNLTEANQLSRWLRNCKTLALYDIKKCTTKIIRNGAQPTQYVVSLLPLQHEILMPATPTPNEVLVKITPQQVLLASQTLFKARYSEDKQRFTTTLSSFSAEVVNQAIVIKNSAGETPLSLAAEKLDSAAFIALVNKVSADALSQALVIKTFLGETPLSLAAEKLDSAAFIALVNKVSADALSQALVIKTFVGDTPLHVAAFKQDSAAFLTLINKVSADALNQALVIKNIAGATPLSLAAFKQDSAAFLTLINKVSADALNQALVIKNIAGATPLSLAAEKQKSAAFMALINKVSADALSQSLVIKNSAGATPLSLAADYKDSAAFMALINKVSADALSQALVIKNNHGSTPLTWAAFKQDSAACMALINKVSADALNQALVIITSSGDTPLIFAAEKFDSATFTALVNKVSTDALNQALLIKNILGYTPLSWAASKQDGAAFMALINKVSSKALNQALVIINSSGNTPLIFAAEKFDSATFTALVNKVSTDALNQALLIKNILGYTPLSWAASKQDGAAFMALINKVSSKALNQALVIINSHHKTPLYSILQKQNSAAIRTLVDKASPAALREALFSATPHKFLDWIEVELASLNNLGALEPWIVLLFKMNNTLNTWPKEKAFTDPETLNTQLSKIQEATIFKIGQKILQQFLLLWKQKAWLEIVRLTAPSLTLTLSNEETIPLLLDPIKLGNDTQMSLMDEGLTQAIQTHGLASWKDFYILEKHCPHHSEANALNTTLALMKDYATLQLSESNPEIFTLNQELQAGNVLMKMFSGWQKNAWPEFIEQLKTPQIRPQLRAPLGTEVSTHKFHHLTAEIGLYAKKDRVKPHHVTHAKKQSTTLISPKKCTPLFKSDEPDALLVGIVLRADTDLSTTRYDPKRAKIKALFFSNAGTYARKWRGSLDQVKAYAKTVKCATSLEQFKEAIKEQSTTWNEVLAEPSKESLMGILIGRDTPAAREMARQYQMDIKRALGIDLPLVKYDATQRELIEDLDLHETVEQIRTLEQEKEQLLSTTPVVSQSFFRRYATYEGRTYPLDLVNRLKSIDKTLIDLGSDNLFMDTVVSERH